MKKNKFIVGIDVSKLDIDVCIYDADFDKVLLEVKVKNSSKGFKSIISFLKKNEIPFSDVVFSYENTGAYSQPLKTFFYINGFQLWEIPSLEIKYSKGITRGKSDRIDAKSIAKYAVTHFHKFRAVTYEEVDIQKLKLLFAEREKTIKSIKSHGRTKENYDFYEKEVYSCVKSINQNILKDLQKYLLKIEEAMEQIVKQNEQLSKQVKLATSVKGVGRQTALYLLVMSNGFTKFETWRQMACYAGVAPFEYSSGTSVKGRTKVNHLANKKMKSLLHMCALNAIRTDAEIKTYFNRKQKEGKNKMLIINNVRSKLLARVFAVVKRGEPYVNLYKFAS